ncbi:MAG: formate--tetrahydrofolate ligase [Erysipelotrichaceae bacterium]|nr:formate--tetrahydrofolate ligase [Erysipelotrichaceae bacterium]MDD3923562.1 formate--tetrahydrofolate ligase [Erysipelotrichaceae bacterium]MDD4642800.1 formate--tetrahydrofolate ligase [Erysipelotrichaceae bacterium]
MKTDIEIAQATQLEAIDIIAKRAKIKSDYLEYYGKYKAKVNLNIFNDLTSQSNGKLILVTALTPTKAGEGKSTTTVGLVDGLAQINKSVIGALREPSLGPVFGIKGGATGGGYAQVVPMEDINLHFTGDMHAITTANNLISAVIDNHIYQGNELNIDPTKVIWKRCVDMNDRALREITIGQGKNNGIIRQDGFNITVASEIMAVLCLSNSLSEFESKVKKIVVAYNTDDEPIIIDQLRISGALAMIMKEAIKPNLVQTLENNPVLIHGGPFANIAHGCNSIIATKLALKLADYVVTEAGFGADLGAEKFIDIKCRLNDIKPNAIVIVATIRALKVHGGQDLKDISIENVQATFDGLANLQKHIETIQSFHIPFIVSLNEFASDTVSEIKVVKEWCEQNGYPFVINSAWAKGGKGATDLAQMVVQISDNDPKVSYIYDLNDDISTKIEKIAKMVYGAEGVEFSDEAKLQLETFNKRGWHDLPICMAKTPNSLSDNAKLVGRPKDFVIHVKELRISAGAGFIVVLTGNVMTMPGLPKQPAAVNMGVDEKGNTYGLF